MEAANAVLDDEGRQLADFKKTSSPIPMPEQVHRMVRHPVVPF